MTFKELIEAESDLLNAISDISKQLRAADKGDIQGFSIDVNSAKTNAGSIISGITTKFNTYKQKANELT